MAVPINVDMQALRAAIQDEYTEVAAQPHKGFHFHTMRAVVESVGLVEFEVGQRRWDTFSGAPSASSAAVFVTQGAAFRAVTPRA